MCREILKPTDRKTLLEAAVASPSADNSQPWQYRWAGDALDLWIDARRAGKPSDVRYVLSDLALGACIENVCIQARALGYPVKVRYFPDEAQSPLWVARLEFAPSTPEVREVELAQAIRSRCTDRRFPWSGVIDDSTRQLLTTEARRLSGVDLLWATEPARKKQFLKVMLEAEALRFRSKALHAELFSSIRWDAGWRKSCEEGLAPATLGIEVPARPLFRALRHQPLMRVMNALGAARLLALRSVYLPVRLSPGLCLVVTSDPGRKCIIDAGRALERIWLDATWMGLAVQPFAAAGIYSMGFFNPEPEFGETLGRIKKLMADITGQQQGIIFLRLGRNLRSHRIIRSSRRPTSDFIISRH